MSRVVGDVATASWFSRGSRRLCLCAARARRRQLRIGHGRGRLLRAALPLLRRRHRHFPRLRRAAPSLPVIYVCNDDHVIIVSPRDTLMSRSAVAGREPPAPCRAPPSGDRDEQALESTPAADWRGTSRHRHRPVRRRARARTLGGRHEACPLRRDDDRGEAKIATTRGTRRCKRPVKPTNTRRAIRRRTASCCRRKKTAPLLPRRSAAIVKFLKQDPVGHIDTCAVVRAPRNSAWSPGTYTFKLTDGGVRSDVPRATPTSTSTKAAAG